MVTVDEHVSVLCHVLGLIGDPGDDTGQIDKTLRANDIKNILDVVNLKRPAVSTFFFKEGNKKIELSKGHQTLLIIVSHFNKSKRKDRVSFQVLDWLKVKQEEFDNFRLDYDEDNYRPSTLALVTPFIPPRSSAPIDPLRDFKRGIRRDPTLCPTLKDIKQWDTWYIETKAQARAQDVEHIFDITYKPTSPADHEIYEQKKKFMYAVFTKTLLTDKGKALVRVYETDFDAQTIHKELFEHAQRSTKASVDASDLLAYITTSHLGTGLWKGSAESCIIHWQNQIRKYEQLVDVKDCFSDNVKRTMLENTVKSIDDLRAVRDQANRFKFG